MLLGPVLSDGTGYFGGVADQSAAMLGILGMFASEVDLLDLHVVHMYSMENLAWQKQRSSVEVDVRLKEIGFRPRSRSTPRYFYFIHAGNVLCAEISAHLSRSNPNKALLCSWLGAAAACIGTCRPTLLWRERGEPS